MPQKRDLSALRKAEKLQKRALLKIQAGRLKEAERDLKRVLKLNPDNVSALNNLGIIYLYYSRYEDALYCFNKALKKDKNNIFTLSSLGVIYLLLYKNKKQALNYVTQAYNRVISMDHDSFIRYFEYHGYGYLAILIVALGLLDKHKMIVNLDKKFGLILHSFLRDADILNIAIAYANEGDYKVALDLMSTYGVSSNKRYGIYYNLINFLHKHNITLKLDYFVEITFLGIIENPLWDKVMSCKTGFFKEYYYAFSDMKFSELAWALLSDEFSFYDKEVIAEILFATGREDYAFFLLSLLYYDRLPLDLKISIYLLAIIVAGYVLKKDEIKEIEDKKLREFIEEYHSVVVFNDNIIKEENNLAGYKMILDIYYKLYEKYPNHVIYLNILIAIAMLVNLTRDDKKYENEYKLALNAINRIIKIVKSAQNPFYMLDIVRIYPLLSKEMSCKEASDILLDALNLIRPNESLPVIYQTMLRYYVEVLGDLGCEKSIIDTIEKTIKERKMVDTAKVSFTSIKMIASGIRKLATDVMLRHQKMYEKYFECDVKPYMQLTDLLSNYSVSLLTGIAKYLRNIKVIKAVPRRKKDLIETINIVVKNSLNEIVMSLKEKKLRDALEYILKHNGIVEFDKFVARYGSDKYDSLYWDFKPPDSILGKLKLTGIVFVGIYQSKKIVFIPQEIRTELVKYLKDA